MMMVLNPQQGKALVEVGKVDDPVTNVSATVKTSPVVSHIASPSQGDENETPELLTNEIIVDGGKGHEST